MHQRYMMYEKVFISYGIVVVVFILNESSGFLNNKKECKRVSVRIFSPRSMCFPQNKKKAAVVVVVLFFSRLCNNVLLENLYVF